MFQKTLFVGGALVCVLVLLVALAWAIADSVFGWQAPVHSKSGCAAILFVVALLAYSVSLCAWLSRAVR